MEYRGHTISDYSKVTVYENDNENDRYRSFGSNDFDLTKEDLEAMLSDLEKKAEELEHRGIEFYDLRFNFYATEYRESDYGDQDAECTVCITYERPETAVEREERINRSKKWIDKKIKNEEAEQERAKRENEREVAKAVEILRKNGYSI